MPDASVRLETQRAKLGRAEGPERAKGTGAASLVKPGVAATGEFAPRKRVNIEAVRASLERTGFDDANKKWKQAPPGVKVIRNRTGSGTWIEKWQSSKTGKWVHNYTLGEMRKRAGAKFVENKLFGDKLPAIRRQVDADMSGDGPERLWATVVRLIDKTFIRVGNEDSAEGGVYGATTLLAEQVSLRGSDVTLDFVGKKKVRQQHTVADAPLARELSALKKRAKRGQPLFQLNGQPITPQQINDYLEPFGVTAKNFRTYHATRMAREYLLAHPARPEDRAAVVKEMFEVNALRLGHSPAVDRDSYVDPMVVTSYLAGKLK